MTNPELLTLLQKKDSTAKKHLFETYYGRLAAIARRYCKNQTQADEGFNVAFHKVWKIKMRKNFYLRMWLYSLILMSIEILLAAFIGLRSVDYLRVLSQSVEHQFLLSVWLTFFLWVLYTIIPDIKVSKIASLISSVAASAALSVIQGSFLWVSLKLFKQNKIYGSLASFPIFLLWLLVVWYVVLCGVSLCAFLQQKIFKRP